MEGSNLNRQNRFREASGIETQKRGPNPDIRAINIAKSNQEQEDKPAQDFTFVYGMAAVWDLLTFLIGLIPVAGWALSAFVIFPIGLFNMYLMLTGKGVSSREFWGGFKYIFLKPIPYINIVPAFIRGVVLIEGSKKGTGIAGAINTATKIVKK